MPENQSLIETYSRINRQSVILAAINLVYQESMRCETIEEFGEACLGIVESVTGSSMSFIGEIGPEGRFQGLSMSKRARSLCSIPEDVMEHQEEKGFVLRGLLGRTVTGGQSVLCNSPLTHPDYFGLPEGHPPLENFLGVPFVHGGKIIGIICAANRKGGYRVEDRECLESLAPSIIESLLRKRAELALRASEAALAEELKSMTLLHQVGTDMLEAGGAFHLLQQILDAAMQISSADKGMLQVRDPESGKLRVEAQHGFDAPYLESFEEMDDSEESPSGQVLRELRRVCVDDLGTCAIYGTRVLKALNESGVRSLACTPLMSRRGKLVGILTTYWTRVHHPEDRILRLIDLLARQAADFILKVQTEEELQKARDELEQRVAERTAELSQTVSTLHEEVVKRIDTEQALRVRSEQLRLMASQLTMAEQRERQRLAQVLHDGLQQVLVGAKYRLALVERSTDLKQSASEIAELIDDAVETSRSLTADLCPPILHQGGLLAALEWLARWMHDKHGLEVELLAGEPVESPPEDLKIFLFQAVRELLFNVIKHAGRRTARIHVSRGEGRIAISVSDDGPGFEPAELRVSGGNSGGFGLFSISERLGLLGGDMTIDSGPARGTRVTLTAPVAAAVVKARAAGARASQVSVAIALDQRAEQEGAERRIRVALVDDHMVMRQGLAGLLRGEPDMEVVGEASDGVSAVNLVRDLRPDVVIMDVTMPAMDGIQATRIIKREMPEVRIIGLSMFEEGEQAEAMRAAGAVGYVTKSGPSDAVLIAIRSCFE